MYTTLGIKIFYVSCQTFPSFILAVLFYVRWSQSRRFWWLISSFLFKRQYTGANLIDAYTIYSIVIFLREKKRCFHPLTLNLPHTSKWPWNFWIHGFHCLFLNHDLPEHFPKFKIPSWQYSILLSFVIAQTSCSCSTLGTRIFHFFKIQGTLHNRGNRCFFYFCPMNSKTSSNVS